MESDEGWLVLKTVVHDIGGSLNQPYSLPPGTSRDRVMVLCRAFDAAMKDLEHSAAYRPMNQISVERIST